MRVAMEWPRLVSMMMTPLAPREPYRAVAFFSTVTLSMSSGEMVVSMLKMSPSCSEPRLRCMSSSTPSRMTSGWALAFTELIPRMNMAAPWSRLPECMFMRMSPPSLLVISSSMEMPLPLEMKLFLAVIFVPSSYIVEKALLSRRTCTCWLSSPALMATCCDRYLGACTNRAVAKVGTLMVNLPSASVMAA